MEHYAQPLLDLIFPVINFIVLSLFGLVLTFLTRFIHGKTRKQQAKIAFDTLNEVILSSVKSMEAEVRPMLSDGRLSKGEAEKIKRCAIEQITTMISPSVTKQLKPYLEDVLAYISNKIEDYVFDIKTHSDDKGGKNDKNC